MVGEDGDRNAAVFGFDFAVLPVVVRVFGGEEEDAETNLFCEAPLFDLFLQGLYPKREVWGVAIESDEDVGLHGLVFFDAEALRLCDSVSKMEGREFLADARLVNFTKDAVDVVFVFPVWVVVLELTHI